MFNYIWEEHKGLPKEPFYMIYVSYTEGGNTTVGWSYDKDTAFDKALAFGLNNIKAIVTYHLKMFENATEKWIVENGELVNFN